MNLVKRFITNESGPMAVEYALIAAGIVLAAYTSIKVAGAHTAGLFGGPVVNLSPTIH
jgi:Flp pilus assembly pilin Flp